MNHVHLSVPFSCVECLFLPCFFHTSECLFHDIVGIDVMLNYNLINGFTMVEDRQNILFWIHYDNKMTQFPTKVINVMWLIY